MTTNPNACVKSCAPGRRTACNFVLLAVLSLIADVTHTRAAEVAPLTNGVRTVALSGQPAPDRNSLEPSPVHGAGIETGSGYFGERAPCAGAINDTSDYDQDRGGDGGACNAESIGNSESKRSQDPSLTKH